MKRHALFVGVDQYIDGHIPNLSCAVSDATDLHGFFKYGAGYDRVELLQNPAGKKEVLGKVRELTGDLGSGDFFLLFFAGHGFRVGENHVLVCANDLYEDVKYEDDGLPLGQLKRRLAGAFDSALLLDACQSDILATRGGEGIAERDLSLIHEAPVDRTCGGALTIVTSCDAGQTAAELSEARHGLFTLAMLDLLKEAQGAHTRLDLSDSFKMSLGRRMREIAARSGLSTEQRPRFSCPGETCFVLLDGAVHGSKVQGVHSSIVSPAYVECPVCGKCNLVTETFRCKVCGKEHLCLSHFSAEQNCCSECFVAERAHTLKPDVNERLGGVQLWKNGPYWAECNVGSAKPEEYGYYFWWGDTVGYRRVDEQWLAVDRSRRDFAFCEENCETYDEDDDSLRAEGYIDISGNLAAAYDAATAHLGAPWRMPTQADFEELINNCTSKWIQCNGVFGRLVSGRGDFASKSIFFPAAGYGDDSCLYEADFDSCSDSGYWSSTPYAYDDHFDYAWQLKFDSNDFYQESSDERYFGLPIRPVRGFIK